MSYILEALADSEQARQQVAAAPRHSLLPAVGEDMPSRRVWPYAVAGALLLNVAVLALWQRPALRANVAPAMAAAVPQAAATLPQAAPLAPQAAETAAPEPRLAPMAESVKPVVNVADIVLRETKLPPPQPERADERRGARRSAPSDAIPAAASANSANDGAAIAMPKSLTPKSKVKPSAGIAAAAAAAPAALATAAAPSAPASVPAPSAPAAVAVPTQPAAAAAGGAEFPPGLQKEVPALHVAGFIHGEDGSSMVIVNDRLVREGDEVAPGVKLERIVGDNLVFNYKGYRFRR